MSEKTKTFLNGIMSIAIVSFGGTYLLNIYVGYWEKNIYPALPPIQKAEYNKKIKMTNMEVLIYDWNKFKEERGWN